MIPDTMRRWLLAERPIGRALRDSDFKLDTAPVPRPGVGEILVRLRYLGFGPALKTQMENATGYAAPMAIGDVLPGSGLAEIVQSNHADYRVGDWVAGRFPWQEYSAMPASSVSAVETSIPLTANSSVLQSAGTTAYFGMLDVGRPRAGETVVVSGASGGVGSIAGQIAKIAGCRVVGITGGAAKCARLKELGFDATVDHRAGDLDGQLKAACPDGVDVFFDNVGGAVLDAVLLHINRHARIAICGAVSTYESSPDKLPPGPHNYFALVRSAAKLEGFLVHDFAARNAEARARLIGWLKDGRIKPNEDIQQGFENAPRVFMRLYAGANVGRQMLKIGE